MATILHVETNFLKTVVGDTKAQFIALLIKFRHENAENASFSSF